MVAKRRAQTKLSLFRTELPLDRMVANYPRQSTKQQLDKNTTSTHEQTIEQREWLKTLGWADDMIVDYDHDLGSSGTLDIEEREGMTLLLSDISKGDIGAVCVFAVDRLFRDEFMINVAYFIKTCAENNCLVITRYRIYDLNDRRDRSRFCEDCERSWEDYEDQIVGKVLYYKQRASEKGLYDGRLVPIGYTVDYDKSSTYYKRFNRHPDHADIVKKWFNRLAELDSWGAFVEELRSEPGPHFPDTVAPAVDGKLFVGSDGCKRRISHVEGGWRYNSYNGLRQLFKNYVYLGVWRTDDVVVENNHPAIIDCDTFFCVQAILERGSYERVTYPEDNKQLLRGILTSESGRFQYAHGTDSYRCSVITNMKQESLMAVNATYLDEVFLQHLWHNIGETAVLKGYEDDTEKVAKEREKKEKEHLTNKVALTEEQIEGYMATLGLPKKALSDKRREEIAKKIAQAEQEIERMKALLDRPSKVEALQELIDLCEQAWKLRDEPNYPIKLTQRLMRKSIL